MNIKTVAVKKYENTDAFFSDIMTMHRLVAEVLAGPVTVPQQSALAPQITGDALIEFKADEVTKHAAKKPDIVAKCLGIARYASIHQINILAHNDTYKTMWSNALLMMNDDERTTFFKSFQRNIGTSSGDLELFLGQVRASGNDAVNLLATKLALAGYQDLVIYIYREQSVANARFSQHVRTVEYEKRRPLSSGRLE